MTNLTGILMKKRKQKGIALLIVIFALLLVTGIALAMMSSSDTETQIERNYRDSQQAYFAALAGIQEARILIKEGNSRLPAFQAPTVVPGIASPLGVIYLLNSNGSDVVQPWAFPSDPTNGKYSDDELCHENFPGLSLTGTNANEPCGTNLPSTSTWYTGINDTLLPNYGSSAALDLKWVRITQKLNWSAGSSYPVDSSLLSTDVRPICWTGTQEVIKDPLMANCTDGSTGKNWETVYRIAALAQTNSSAFGQGSRRMLIAEVAKTPPLVTNAAVDSEDNVTLHGQLNVNGFDTCTCKLNYSKTGGYVTTNCTTTTNKDGTTTTVCPDQPWAPCDNSKYAIYASGTVDTATKSENLVAGTNPAVVENQPWPYQIQNLIDTYKQGAVDVTQSSNYGWTCTPATYDSNGNLIANANCGTQSGSTTSSFGVPPPFPVPYNNDGTINTTGLNPQPASQTTYIPGSVKLTSSWNGNGILIVDGDLEINGGLQYYGLILVKGVVKFTGGGSDSTNIVGAVLAGQESYVDNTLGGSAVVDFNSCALKQNRSPQPPRLVGIREATY